MVGRPASIVGGIALGGVPTTLMTSAATGSLPWALATAACIVVGGTVLFVQRLRSSEHTDRTVAWTGLVGGIGLAAVALFYDAGPRAFPGGPVTVWVLAGIMILASIPVFGAAARRRANRPVARLRTIRIVAETSHPGAKRRRADKGQQRETAESE